MSGPSFNNAGLAKLIRLSRETNVQGGEQKKLDILSNDVFVKDLISSGRTSIIVKGRGRRRKFCGSSIAWKCRYCVTADKILLKEHSDANLKSMMKSGVEEECVKLGPIELVKVCENHPQGVVLVRFKDTKDAHKCIELINGR